MVPVFGADNEYWLAKLAPCVVVPVLEVDGEDVSLVEYSMSFHRCAGIALVLSV